MASTMMGYPGDVYYKGGNMLNTLRTLTNDDEKWRGMLRTLGEVFYHKTVTSAEFEAQIAESLEMNLEATFDQFLRDRRLPTFEYYFKDGTLMYRWINAIDTFDMPLDVVINGKKSRLSPTTRWGRLATEGNELSIDENFYIGVLKSR